MTSGLERIVVGTWLRGEHLDDIQDVEPRDFDTCSDIIAAIKKHGAFLPDVCRATGVNAGQLALMMQEADERAYRQVMDDLRERKLRELIKGGDVPLEEIEKAIEKYRRRTTAKQIRPAAGWSSMYYDELDRRKNQGIIHTGITGLDMILHGVRTGELTTIAARPATGKSAFLLQVGLYIARQGKKVLFFPLEMTAAQIIERTYIMRGLDVPVGKLMRGDLGEGWKRVERVSEGIDALEATGNFRIYEAVNNISEIEHLIRDEGPCVVIIDQLSQLTADRSFADTRIRFNFMTRTLKHIALSENVAIWLAAQINRDARGAEPALENIKESASAEEDSDNVVILHRIPEDQMSSDGWSDTVRPMLIKVAKQRMGRTGGCYARFDSDKFIFRSL